MDVILGNAWLLFFSLIILLPMLYSILSSDSRIWTYQSVSVISVIVSLVLNIISSIANYVSVESIVASLFILLWQISLVFTTVCIFYLVFTELKEKYLRYQMNNDWVYCIPALIEVIFLILLKVVATKAPQSELVQSSTSLSIFFIVNFYLLHGAWLCYKSSLYNLDFDIKYIARKHLYFYTLLCLSFMVEQVIFNNIAFGASYVVFLCFNYMTKSKTMISQDALSGVNNRVSFNKYINNVFISRNHDGAYILFIDIDKFKQINDTFGHIEGDEAITLVGKTLKSIAGEINAFVARIGGDEFVMITKDDNDDAVRRTIQSITYELEERLIFSDKQYDITVSCGFTKIEKNQKNIKELLAKADEYMYQEKMRKKCLEVANGSI